MPIRRTQKKQHGTVRKGGAVLVLCLFLGPEDLPRLRNEAGAEVRVGLAFVGVNAGEEREEAFVAGELGEVAAALLDAHVRAAADGVRVDEREVVARSDAVVEDVGRREVAVEKSPLVEARGEACEGFSDLALLVGRGFGERGHGVAVLRQEAHVVDRGAPEAVAVADERHRLGTLESPLAQEHGADECLLSLRRLVDHLLELAPERGARKALHAEREPSHLEGADGVAPGMDFAAFAVEVFL